MIRNPGERVQQRNGIPTFRSMHQHDQRPSVPNPIHSEDELTSAQPSVFHSLSVLSPMLVVKTLNTASAEDEVCFGIVEEPGVDEVLDVRVVWGDIILADSHFCG
jgi:hypothetical protein